MSDVETVRPLELLNRAATFVGAVVCLTSSADRRRAGVRPFSRDEGSQLRALVVVKPAPTFARYGSRWERLQAGIVLCKCDLEDAVPIDDAAEVLVEQLHTAINDWRKRSAA